MGNNKNFWIDYVIILSSIVCFFLISFYGFWWTDDIGFQEVHINNINELLQGVKIHYLTWGGGLLGKLLQDVFCNILENYRIVFDIVNTLMFVLLLLISGKMVAREKEKIGYCTSAFVLFFWFLCPKPSQTLFWAVGSIAYLWTLVLSLWFLFILFYYKDENYTFLGKVGLFLFSIFCASSIIPSVSICGALVVYYIFNIRQLKNNAIPLVVGFLIGSIILVFSPGNFARSDYYNIPWIYKIKDLAFHPFFEMGKYKALWLFLMVLIYGKIKNKNVVKKWLKEKIIFLFALAWSIIAFSFVFRPGIRAVIFTEVLSIILVIWFVIDNIELFPFSVELYRRWWIKCIVLLLLVFDANCAINETKFQRFNNEQLLTKITNCEGVFAMDVQKSNHRMANAPDYPEWTWATLANHLKLDSVHIYPYYCQNNYYGYSNFSDDVFIEWNGSSFEKVRLILRINDSKFNNTKGQVVFYIEYERPKKWYKSLLNKSNTHKRTVFVEKNAPEDHFEDYSYYVIWFSRENAMGIKNLRYEIN